MRMASLALALVMLACAAARAGDAIILLEDPRAVDGDTLAVDRPGVGVVLSVRLFGIAAPELSEPGGQRSRQLLQELVNGRTIVCRPVARASYGRVVATCAMGVLDLGSALVRAGAARDCPAYSGRRYAADETDVAKALPLPAWCRTENRP